MDSECGEKERGGVAERAMTCVKRERNGEGGGGGVDMLTLHRSPRAGLIFRLPVETLALKNNLKQTASITTQ